MPFLFQKGIDASFFLYFARFNENVSPLLQKNIQDFTNNAANAADEDFIESNFMYGKFYNLSMVVIQCQVIIDYDL